MKNSLKPLKASETDLLTNSFGKESQNRPQVFHHSRLVRQIFFVGGGGRAIQNVGCSIENTYLALSQI